MIFGAMPADVFRRFRPTLWLWASAAATSFLLCSVFPGSTNGQISPLPGSEGSLPSSIHGTVLNRVTHEPIGRALVYSPDRQFATLTDDRGYFEFKLPPEPEPKQESSGTVFGSSLRFTQNSRPTIFFAKKPGYLSNENRPASYVSPAVSEITLYLVPESLIVGHVNISESEGEVRIRMELFRKEISAGKERWEQAGTFTTWADGEFRFSNLSGGTYKLISTEELDRDPLTFTPGGKLFGYPPAYYPSATDFAGALPLQLAAGATLQADITVTRRAYYNVKIPVANAPAGQQPINVEVYPLGHPGPGYSLGYNPSEQQIQGMLPDGNYSLKVEMFGPSTMTGILNFSVHGAALEGPPVNLIPDASVVVKVNEEFSSDQTNIQQGLTDPAGTKRQIGVQVNLTPIDEFNSRDTLAAEQDQEAQDSSLIIRNVRPGQYRVQASSGLGYAASIQSNGKDLLHEPLNVGMGGSVSPIEITLRNDAAELTITPEPGQSAGDQKGRGDARQLYVYLLPIEGGQVQLSGMFMNEQSTSMSQQLRPGSYRVLVFDQQQEGLDYADKETLKKFESRGQVVELSANHKQQIRANIIREDDSQ
jgi:hypothetical protein